MNARMDLARRTMSAVPLALIVPALLVVATSVGAQLRDRDESWLERCRDHRGGNDDAVHCEEREYRLPGDLARLDVDAAPNGGIAVEGWDRDEVLVQARIQAHAEDERDAREMAEEIAITTTGGRIRADGPRGHRDGGWSVSYRIFVPRRMSLDLQSHNGGIALDGVSGDITLETHNGGLSLRDVGGDVRGETQNGGIRVQLTGERWEGKGLDLETHNGGVTVVVPDDYNAHLVTGTRNGGMNLDFPVTLQGRIDRRRIELDLGRGGAPIRVQTTNGGVNIRRESQRG